MAVHLKEYLYVPVSNTRPRRHSSAVLIPGYEWDIPLLKLKMDWDMGWDIQSGISYMLIHTACLSQKVVSDGAIIG